MPEHSASPGVSPFLYPLDEFYARANRVLPAIEPVVGDQVPAPYNSLLVHSGDMTSKLEQFHGESVRLEVLSRQQRGDFYFREVVLILNQREVQVEFGAIKINLFLLPSIARREILQEIYPLGYIFEKYKIAYASRPKAFLRVESDPFIEGALRLSASSQLYGRRNTLLDPSRRSLAEVVEILPPIREGDKQTHSALGAG